MFLLPFCKNQSQIKFLLIREGSDIYKELKKYKFDVDLFKKAGWSHELLKKIVDAPENNH